MDFEKIKYFLVLADTLNYTKASQQLYISQSMLSRHIMAMEEEIGMPLFTRNSHGVALTTVGTYLKNGLGSINNEYDMVIQRARVISSGLSGELRIGIISATGLSHIRSLLIKYEKRNPSLKIVLSVVSSPSELSQSLAKGRIDLGFGMPIFSLPPSLSSMQICSSRLLLAMSKHHPLAKTAPGELALADLKDATFITPVDDISTAFKRLNERCLQVGFLPNVITVSDIMVTVMWVEMNRGVTFLHDFSMMRGNPNLVLFELNDIDTLDPYCAYWNSEHQDAKVLAFLDYLREETRQAR